MNFSSSQYFRFLSISLSSRANGQMPKEIEWHDFDDLRFRFNLFSKGRARQVERKGKETTMDWRRNGKINWFSFCNEVTVRCIRKSRITKPAINCHHWYCQVPLASVLRLVSESTISVEYTPAYRNIANDGVCKRRFNGDIHSHSFRTQLNLSQSLIWKRSMNAASANKFSPFQWVFLNLIAFISWKSLRNTIVHLILVYGNGFPATNHNKLSSWHLRNVKCKIGSVIP